MEHILAENIRNYRKSLGLTQEQLAERLGITLGTVSKWERGSSEPDLSYVMELAELFRVSVDALIGFSMRGTDADTEADRIDELSDAVVSGELTIWKIAEEYEIALSKFPNHFRIVFGAASTFQQIGVVYRREAELRKALELFRHAISLISQNRDPRINEVILQDEIASCYCSLKDYKKAIEEYKKNNLTGNNDARIGLLYTVHEKKPEEGLEYTERAFVYNLGDMITTMAGYLAYYVITGKYDQGIRAAEWLIRLLESLKSDPDRRSYLDKIACLIYLDLAIIQDRKGQTEASEENLRTAVQIAGEFDSDPVFTLDNLILTEGLERIRIYDDTGPTATGGLSNSLEEYGDCVSDAFRMKLERAIGKTGKES